LGDHKKGPTNENSTERNKKNPQRKREGNSRTGRAGKRGRHIHQWKTGMFSKLTGREKKAGDHLLPSAWRDKGRKVGRKKKPEIYKETSDLNLFL